MELRPHLYVLTDPRPRPIAWACLQYGHILVSIRSHAHEGCARMSRRLRITQHIRQCQHLGIELSCDAGKLAVVKELTFVSAVVKYDQVSSASPGSVPVEVFVSSSGVLGEHNVSSLLSAESVEVFNWDDCTELHFVNFLLRFSL